MRGAWDLGARSPFPPCPPAREPPALRASPGPRTLPARPPDPVCVWRELPSPLVPTASFTPAWPLPRPLPGPSCCPSCPCAIPVHCPLGSGLGAYSWFSDCPCGLSSWSPSFSWDDDTAVAGITGASPRLCVNGTRDKSKMTGRAASRLRSAHCPGTAQVSCHCPPPHGLVPHPVSQTGNSPGRCPGVPGSQQQSPLALIPRGHRDGCWTEECGRSRAALCAQG